MRIISTLIVFLFCNYVAVSQTDSIAYSRDYEFNEGIYLTIEQFKSNSPVQRQSIVTSIPRNELDFFYQITEQKKVVYIDSAGKEQHVETSTIWGYCQNRAVYINLNKEFNKLNVIGMLCHFTATVRINAAYHDPMHFNNTVDELRQFVLDMKTNKIYEFGPLNMEQLLQNDPELYNQFKSLKRRDKANSIFVYLRKFNDRHPFYLPPIYSFNRE